MLSNHSSGKMQNNFLLIFVSFISQSQEQLAPEAFERLFGNGEIQDRKHKEISKAHITSSMDDLLELCEYEKSIQDRISRLPESKLKSSYYKHLKPDVIYKISS